MPDVKAMLVHEAVAHLAGRALRFADAKDIEAERLLTLHTQAVAKARRRLTVPEHLQEKLREFEQTDAHTLVDYIQPRRKRQKRRVHGG